MQVQPYQDDELEVRSRGLVDAWLADASGEVLPPGFTIAKAMKEQNADDPLDLALARMEEEMRTGRLSPAPRLRSERSEEVDPDAFRPDLGQEVDDSGNIVK